MKIYGLTGGIASGKSTVADELRACGVTVVDADALSRHVVAPGTPGYESLREAFPQVFDSAGALDRKALGALVFADAGARRMLESITHPLIAQASAEALSAAQERGEPIAFYEAALLVEKNLDASFDGLVVVSAPAEVQLARVMQRDGLDEAGARARLAAQAPLEQKLARATHVIENSGSIEDTRARVRELLSRLVPGEG